MDDTVVDDDVWEVLHLKEEIQPSNYEGPNTEDEDPETGSEIDGVHLRYKLAAALAELIPSDDVWKKVTRLRACCPLVPVFPEGTPPAKVQSSLSAFAKALKVNSRDQAAILALAHYVEKSQGNYAEALVPFLLKYVQAIEYFPIDSNVQLLGDQFVYSFFTKILNISGKACSGDITQSLTAFFNKISEKSDSVALLISFFRAIGCSQNFPLKEILLPSIVKYATGDEKVTASLAKTEASTKAVVMKRSEEKKKKKHKKDEKKSSKKKRESLEVAKEELQDELKVTPLLFVRLLSLELLRRAATPLRTSDERELNLCNDIAMGCLKGNQFVEVEIKGVQLATTCALRLPRLEGPAVEQLCALLTAHKRNANETVQDEEVVLLYQAVLKGLVDLARKYTTSTSRILETLRGFCLEDLTQLMLRHPAATRRIDSIRQYANEALSAVLQTALEKLGAQSLNYFSHALSNQLFTSHTEYAKRIQKRETATDLQTLLLLLVPLMGYTTAQLNSPAVSDVLVPSMINRLCVIENEFTPIDSLLLTQLVDVAIKCQQNESTFASITSYLVNLYRSKSPAEDQPGSVKLAAELTRLSAGLTAPDAIEELCGKLLTKFANLATAVQRNKLQNSGTALQSMGALLPAIAQVIPSPSAFQNNPQLLKQHRALWLYCLRFRFVVPNAKNNDWFVATQQIAWRSPPFLNPGANRGVSHMAVEAEVASTFENDPANDVIAARKQLAELIALPAYTKQINSFNFIQCTYLLAVYFLETLRVQCQQQQQSTASTANTAVVSDQPKPPSSASGAVRLEPVAAPLPSANQLRGPFRRAFQYLEDLGLSASLTAIGECLGAICDMVVNLYLARLTDQSPNARSRRDTELESETQFVIVNYCHRELRIRAAADRYLVNINTQFPQLLWSRVCISTLLDMFEVVAKGSDESLFFRQSIFPLPNTAYTVALPEETADRKALLNDVTRLCNVWLRTATVQAPTETANVLQQYLQVLQSTADGFFGHVGFSLAVGIESARNEDDQKMPPKDFMSNWDVKLDPSRTSSFVNRLQLKALASGQITATIERTCELEGASQADAVYQLAEELIGKLKSFMAEKARDPAAQSKWSAQMVQATALLTVSKSIEEDLLDMVIWAPVIRWTEESMATGVWLWGWLLAARPDLDKMIMTKLADAWTWTVAKRVGLFSDAPRKASPLAMKPAEPVAATKEALSDVKPHRLWLRFWSERFEVVQHRGDFNSLFSRMLLHSLENALGLSILPLALGARFQLLTFAMKFLARLKAQPGGQSRLTENLLREYIYNAALSWFLEPPSWYNPGSREQLVDDVKTLMEFMRLIEADSRDVLSARGNGMSPATAKRVGFSGSGASGPGNMSSRTPRKKLSEKNEERDSDLSNVAWPWFKQLRTLLQVFLANEIERAVYWHNPLGLPSLAIPGQQQYLDKLTQVKMGRELLRAAWSHHPRLAVQLVARIPNLKMRQELESKIRHQPAALLEEPSAILYLSTKMNVSADIPQLRYLLTWRPGVPTTALALLDKNNFHPLLVKCAIRLLRSHAPATIVFYIPQLIQTLRWDTTGMMEQYFLAVCKRSQILAHQLIWNASTYTEDKESQSLFASTDKGLTPAATSLRAKIIANFSPEERRLWDDESRFFEEVTSISGQLRQLPKEGPQRREHLKQALKKIQTQGRLYLPSNPDTTVLGINPDGAAPMQSAAKSPILVPFLVEGRPAILEGGGDEPLRPVESRGAQRLHEQMISSQHQQLERTLQRRMSITGVLHQLIPHRPGVEKQKDKAPMLQPVSLIAPKAPPVVQMKPAAEAEVQKRWQACIFKVGDDVRQDMLALQIIALFKRIFEAVGLDLYLFPYRVVATAPGCGIIEVVPNSTSRDQLGKKVEGTLYEYFQDKYGPINSIEFQKARKNFIQSMAAYSVVTFLLQIKDRHNGNILVDEEGHIVHIDFGFMFDIGPGGIKFERAPFKASEEMVLLLGSRPDAEQFKWFMEKSIQAFLAAREYQDAIITMIALMMDTDFPCWRPTTIPNVQGRFQQGRSIREAANYMKGEISSSFKGTGYASSFLYDVFQEYTQGIAH